MDKKLKKELLNYLQDISYAYEDGCFWKAWNAMHKFLWDQPETDGECYYEIYVEDEAGCSVHDTDWNRIDAMEKADTLKSIYPNAEVGVIEYKEVGVIYKSEEV